MSVADKVQPKHYEIEARENFHTLANSIPQLAWMADDEGYIFWYNQRWYDYTGTTLEEMQGWGWQKVHHPEEVGRVVERIKQAFETGEPWEDVFPLRSREGEYRWFLSRALPIRDEEGRVVRWFGTNTDVTEQRRLEQELRKARAELEDRVSERTAELSRANFILREQVLERRRAEESLLKQTEILKSILNQMGDPVVVADRDEKFLIFNPAAERMFGAGASETPAQEWPERYGLFLPDKVTPFPHDELPLSRAIRGEEVDDIEMFVRHASAPEGLWTRITARPLRDATGELAGGVAVCRDITERKLAEEALSKSEEELRLVADGTGLGMWFWDENSSALTWDRKAKQLFGLPAETKMTAELFFDLLHPDDRDDVHQVWRAAVEGGVEYQKDFRTRWPDGSVHWIASRGRVYQDERGSPTKMRGIVLDITERKRAEEALKENEAQLAGIVGLAMDGIITVDESQRIVLFNVAAERIFGCPASEAMGQTLNRFIPTRFRQAHGTHVRLYGETGETQRLMGSRRELYGLRDSGEEFPLEASISQLERNGQKVFTVMLRDITERKLAEEARRESEEKYRTLFESIDEGFCVFDMIYDAAGRAVDFIFRVTNPAFERQTGLQNAVGRRVSELLPDLEEVWVKKYEQVAATGEPQRFTEYAAGLNKWYEVYSFRVGVAGSNRVAVLFSDITERKRAEEALRREKEFSDTSIESLPGVFYHYDKTGRFLRWNRNFETVTGYSHEEIGQMHPLDFFAGDDKRLIEERIGRVFDTGEGDAEADFVCKDGRAIPYYFTGRRVLFDSEPYLVGVGIDIAERKRAEEALREVQSDLARMSRVTALGELAASIAHEVNQPLTSLIGNAEICLMLFDGEAPDIPQAREILSDIYNDGRRASEILKRIRNLVRKGVPQRAQLDINEVVGEVMSLVASAAGVKRVRAQSSLCADLPQVLGDRVQLQQVLLNLMVNAMDAMGIIEEERRELVVETQPDDERSGVRVAVRDRGPGLTSEDAVKVFGAFYTTKAEGMGMGLSISRSIIRAHGGRLWAEPNDGGGACFLFTLPAAEVAP